MRRAGTFTEVLHTMQCGDIVGLRGPFGRGFPVDEMRGHDILLVAGGLGIAPLRSLINNIHDERSEFGKVTIIYGSKNPSEVMFRQQFEMWRHRKDFDLHLTVDHPDDTWDGEVGVVTKPFEHLEIDASNTYGALCGPPVMYRFAIDEMRKKNISYDRIYVSFERHMKCGMGKCGHCQIGHQYVCIDGPVFNYWEAHCDAAPQPRPASWWRDWPAASAASCRSPTPRRTLWTCSARSTCATGSWPRATPCPRSSTSPSSKAP